MTELERGLTSTRYQRKLVVEIGEYIDDLNSKWTWQCKNPPKKEKYGLTLKFTVASSLALIALSSF